MAINSNKFTNITSYELVIISYYFFKVQEGSYILWGEDLLWSYPRKYDTVELPQKRSYCAATNEHDNDNDKRRFNCTRGSDSY